MELSCEKGFSVNQGYHFLRRWQSPRPVHPTPTTCGVPVFKFENGGGETVPKVLIQSFYLSVIVFRKHKSAPRGFIFCKVYFWLPKIRNLPCVLLTDPVEEFSTIFVHFQHSEHCYLLFWSFTQLQREKIDFQFYSGLLQTEYCSVTLLFLICLPYSALYNSTIHFFTII